MAEGTALVLEASTYGAILDVVGIGLVVWRKRRRAANAQPTK